MDVRNVASGLFTHIIITIITSSSIILLILQIRAPLCVSCPLRPNIAKGTTDPRVEFCLPKLKQVQTQILIKFHLQNFDQASTSRSQPNISLSIKRKLQNLDQAQLQNPDQDSTSQPLQKISRIKLASLKSCLNFNIKILTKTCAQSVNKSLAL